MMEPGLESLPLPWQPIVGGQADAELRQVWSYWRGLYPDMALTPEQELEREAGPGHPLAGAVCRAIAWGVNGKEFAFVTDRPGVPVAVVHLTFYRESNPRVPFTAVYDSVGAFVRHQQSVEDWSRERSGRTHPKGAAE